VRVFAFINSFQQSHHAKGNPGWRRPFDRKKETVAIIHAKAKNCRHCFNQQVSFRIVTVSTQFCGWSVVGCQSSLVNDQESIFVQIREIRVSFANSCSPGLTLLSALL